MSGDPRSRNWFAFGSRRRAKSAQRKRPVRQIPIPGIDPALHREAKTADTIRVLRADVTTAETQHFSRIRTGLLAGVGVVVFIGTSGSSSGVDDGPGHHSAFWSFLSFAIPTGR